MDKTEVRERVPEDLLERIRLLTTQAESIDRNVEALARETHKVIYEYMDRADAADHRGDFDLALAEASGYNRLDNLLGVISLRAATAAGGHIFPGHARDEGFEGFGIDQEVSA